MKIFSVVDPDSESGNPHPDRSFEWDVYHIENYLLESRFIFKIIKDLGVTSFATEEDVYAELRDCARATMTGLVRHKLASTAHGELIKLIRTSTDPNSASVAPALATILKQSAESIAAIVRNDFDSVHLEAREKALRAEFEKALAADTWRKRFRGRDVLKQFVARIQKTNYEVFRDLIIANMRDSGFTPEGMRLVMESILAA